MIAARLQVDAARAALRERLTSFGMLGSVDSLLEHHVAGRHVELDRAIAELRLAELERESAEFDAAQPPTASVDIARARVGLARALASEAALDYRSGRLAVVAPEDGVVMTPDLERLVGTVAQSGQAVVELAAARPWLVEVPLSESDVDRVRVGSNAVLEILALPADEDREMQGEVRSIAIAAIAQREGTSAAPVFTARIAIAEEDGRAELLSRLRTGFTVRVRITGARATLIAELWRRLAEVVDRVR